MNVLFIYPDACALVLFLFVNYVSIDAGQQNNRPKTRSIPSARGNVTEDKSDSQYGEYLYFSGHVKYKIE